MIFHGKCKFKQKNGKVANAHTHHSTHNMILKLYIDYLVVITEENLKVQCLAF